MKQYKQPYFKIFVITTENVLAASTDPAGSDNENWFSILGVDVYD